MNVVSGGFWHVFPLVKGQKKAAVTITKNGKVMVHLFLEPGQDFHQWQDRGRWKQKYNPLGCWPLINKLLELELGRMQASLWQPSGPNILKTRQLCPSCVRGTPGPEFSLQHHDSAPHIPGKPVPRDTAGAREKRTCALKQPGNFRACGHLGENSYVVGLRLDPREGVSHGSFIAHCGRRLEAGGSVWGGKEGGQAGDPQGCPSGMSWGCAWAGHFPSVPNLLSRATGSPGRHWGCRWEEIIFPLLF